MKTVSICSGTIQTSRLGFGTASIHHKFRQTDQQALLKSAFDTGIRFYDTAPIYGEGIAENALGTFSRGIRDEITLVSKFGLEPHKLYSRSKFAFYLRKAASKLPLVPSIHPPSRNFDSVALQTSLEGTLKRLKTDYLDILVLHEPLFSEISCVDTLVYQLNNLVTAGKIRHFGISTTAQEASLFISNAGNLCAYIQLWLKPNSDNRIVKIPDATFGHFKKQQVKSSRALYLKEVMNAAKRLNSDGVILFSSLSAENIRATAEMITEIDNES